MELGAAAGQVEVEPCGAGVAVARLADRTRIEEPAAAELRARAVGSEPAAKRVVDQADRQRNVAVADEDDGIRRLDERRVRGFRAQHVVPHRIERARVEELAPVHARARLEP